MILIYLDNGVSKASALGWYHYYQSINHSVRLIDSQTVREGGCFLDAKLFVLPGGRSKPFYHDLSGGGNSNIIHFVHGGGSFLGVCAGAYYACKETVFAEGLPLEVLMPGALNFFNGCAIGPVFEPEKFAYHSELGARVVSLALLNGRKLSSYWNGGCFFSENFNGDEQYQIVARYAQHENQLPAIISGECGQGKVLLSGVHPELCEQTILDDGNPTHLALRNSLAEIKMDRFTLMSTITQQLL